MFCGFQAYFGNPGTYSIVPCVLYMLYPFKIVMIITKQIPVPAFKFRVTTLEYVNSGIIVYLYMDSAASIVNDDRIILSNRSLADAFLGKSLIKVFFQVYILVHQYCKISMFSCRIDQFIVEIYFYGVIFYSSTIVHSNIVSFSFI